MLNVPKTAIFVLLKNAPPARLGTTKTITEIVFPAQMDAQAAITSPFVLAVWLDIIQKQLMVL